MPTLSKNATPPGRTRVYEQFWEIEKEFFPPSPLLPFIVHGEVQPPYQYAYLCPHCGRVWARRGVTPATKWMALHRSCASCPGERFTQPGSIVQLWDRFFISQLPRAILERELLLEVEKETT